MHRLKDSWGYYKKPPDMCFTCPNYKYCSVVDSQLWVEQIGRCLENGEPIDHIGVYLRKRKEAGEMGTLKNVVIDGVLYVPFTELADGEVLKIAEVNMKYGDGFSFLTLGFYGDKVKTKFSPGDVCRIVIEEKNR